MKTKITNRDNKERMLNLLKHYYKVKIKFKPLENKDGWGHYYVGQNKMVVHSMFKNDINKLIPIIFHELGHAYCERNNLFVNYHWGTDPELYKLTALRAERYVDKWAKKEMKKHGFKIRYYPFYYNKKSVKWFRKYVESEYSRIKKIS